MIYSIITRRGRTGETRFDQATESKVLDFYKDRAVRELHTSEIMEWYRNQYNIPLDQFYEKPVDIDIAHVDFYRRHFWAEVKFGVRVWGDQSSEMKMPPFTMLRPYGGILPPPNGFGLTDEFTIPIEKYREAEKAASNNNDEDEGIETLGDSEYTRIVNKQVPAHVKEFAAISSTGQTSSSEVTFGMGDEEFWKMVDDEWETIEEITGPKPNEADSGN